MNLKEIKEVIQLMNENNLNEIEIEKNGLKIRMVKGQKAVIQQISAPQTPAAVEVELSRPEQTAQKEKGKYVEIKSPMVGTFYKSPSPDASPFVEVGDEVSPGSIICIIEAMKLMNEIKSEIKGKVKEVLVENGQAIEFGQPLFLIEPA